MDEANRLLNIDWLRATGAEPQWFGLGFVQLKLNKEERVHFWCPALGPDVSEEEVHDHRYTFNSDILKGEITHYVFDFVSSVGSGIPPTHEMVQVSCDPKGPQPNDRPSFGWLQDIGFQTLPVGSSYTFLQGRFHRTLCTVPTVTYVCREEPVVPFARVVRPINTASVCPFSNPKPVNDLWEIIEDTLGPPPGYHISQIEKGVLGDPSKIREEVEEFIDATQQGVSIMALVELADLMGAVEAYLAKNHPSLSLDDLRAMSNVTKRAFINGHRN